MTNRSMAHFVVGLAGKVEDEGGQDGDAHAREHQVHRVEELRRLR